MATLALGLVAVLAWGALLALVVTVPPSQLAATVAFYAFLFSALASTATGLASWASRRRRRLSHTSSAAHVGHGLLFASVCSVGLWLQSERMLTAIAVLLLAGLFGFVELFWAVGRRGDRRPTDAG